MSFSLDTNEATRAFVKEQNGDREYPPWGLHITRSGKWIALKQTWTHEEGVSIRQIVIKPGADDTELSEILESLVITDPAPDALTFKVKSES